MPYDFRSDPILGKALDYWQSKREGRLMPRRRDIDPTEMRSLLPYLQLTELVDGGARVRYRLVGTAIADAYGAELTGKYFDEAFSPERLRIVEENYRTISREKRPLFVCNYYYSARCAELFCTRLVMPLSEDDVVVSQCLTAMSFHYPDQVSKWPGDWGFRSGSTVDARRSYAELVG